MITALKSPMHQYLDKLLDESLPKGQAEVVLQFTVSPVAAKGALRRVEGFDGLFEFLTINQGADAQGRMVGRPYPVSQVFSPETVAAVVKIGSPDDLPQIIPPPNAGGIQAPV